MSEVSTEPRVFAITTRTLYHVLAHSQEDALRSLRKFSNHTPLDFDGGHTPWIDTIYTEKLDAADVQEASHEYAPGDLSDMWIVQHRENCDVCLEHLEREPRFCPGRRLHELCDVSIRYPDMP